MASLLRRRTTTIQPPPTLPSLAASAAPVNIADTSRTGANPKSPKLSDRQKQAWDFYDRIGEAKFALNFIGNNLSQLRLFPAIDDDPSADPIPVDEALPRPADGDREPFPGIDGITPELVERCWVELRRLRSPQGDAAAILWPLAVNFEAVGECYLVGEPSRDPDAGEDETWDIYSLDEIRVNDGKWEVKEGDGQDQWRQLPVATEDQIGEPSQGTAYVIRMWLRHARWKWRADSPLMGVLEQAEELLILSQQVRAVGRSRLAQNGVFLVPREAYSDYADPTDPSKQTTVADLLVKHFVTPIQDEGSAAAVVPFVLAPPAQYIEQVRYVELTRGVDTWASSEREKLLRRLAQGLDIPPEVVLGIGDMNHWNSWLVDEQTWSANMRPLAIKIVDSLTIGFFRPMLLAAGLAPDIVRRLRLWFDPSAVTSRPDLDKNAQEVFDAGELSGEALRRHRGFTEDDAPSEDERAAKRAAQPAPFPELDEPGPPNDGEPTPDEAEQDAEQETTLVAAAGRRAALGQRLARIDAGLRDRLLTAADTAVVAAVEKVGARLKARVAGGGGNARRTGPLHDVIRGVPTRTVAATLGEATARTLLAAAGEDDLIDSDEFAALAATFDTLTARAQEQALRMLAAELDIDDDELDEIRARQTTQRAEAWGWLAVALVGLANRRLFDTSADAPAEGEFDPTISVPAATIREAVARAGGEDVTVESGAMYANTGTQPAGGVATGRTARDVMAQHGAVITGYRWDYGDPSARMLPFPPHERVDGEEFTSWQDPDLRNDDPFPPVPFLSPGDHAGCRCSYELLIRTPVEGEE